MKLSGNCSLLEMRGVYLLTIPPRNGAGQQALKVNSSFAFLWKQFCERPSFTREELSRCLIDSYGLGDADASREAELVLNLWKEWKLLED